MDMFLKTTLVVLAASALVVWAGIAQKTQDMEKSRLLVATCLNLAKTQKVEFAIDAKNNIHCTIGGKKEEK